VALSALARLGDYNDTSLQEIKFLHGDLDTPFSESETFSFCYILSNALVNQDVKKQQYGSFIVFLVQAFKRFKESTLVPELVIDTLLVLCKDDHRVINGLVALGFHKELGSHA